jgi:hypothetical protein
MYQLRANKEGIMRDNEVPFLSFISLSCPRITQCLWVCSQIIYKFLVASLKIIKSNYQFHCVRPSERKQHHSNFAH